MSKIEQKGRSRFAIGRRRLQTPVREPIVLVIEDQPLWSIAVRQLCDWLDVGVSRVLGLRELRLALRDQRPMAVLSEMESASVDGCDVLKLVGAHDPDLPVMVRTAGDPVLTGAGEAMQEILGLSGAMFVPGLPGPGEMIEFLCKAGQRGRCLGLMPI